MCSLYLLLEIPDSLQYFCQNTFSIFICIRSSPLYTYFIVLSINSVFDMKCNHNYYTRNFSSAVCNPNVISKLRVAFTSLNFQCCQSYRLIREVEIENILEIGDACIWNLEEYCRDYIRFCTILQNINGWISRMLSGCLNSFMNTLLLILVAYVN